METNHALMTSLAQASAALLILSIIVNLVIIIGAIIAVIILVFMGRGKISLTCFAVADAVDAVLVLGPAIMWTYMLMNVTNDNVYGNSAAVGPGFGMLWLSFVAKICADESLLRCVKSLICCRKSDRGVQQVGSCLEDLECCIVRGTERATMECIDCCSGV